jgi:hypothetical protein
MTKTTPSPDSDDNCHGTLHPAALAGLEFFNQGEYFEAHEALEEAWRDETGPIRDLYRGILQIGVAYYHILRGNYTGAVKLFARCGQWLDPFPDFCLGINLKKLREDSRAVSIHLEQIGPEGIQHFRRSLLKPIEYTLPDDKGVHHG